MGLPAAPEEHRLRSAPAAMEDCAGFSVHSADGRIGTVLAVLHDGGPTGSPCLVVRCGLFHERLLLVRAEEVAEVRLEARCVVLRHVAGALEPGAEA